MSAGYPSWTDLLSELTSEAEDCRPGFLSLPVKEDLLEQAQAIRDHIDSARGREHFQNLLGKRFGKPPNLIPFHTDLLRLPFRGYATTNYDATLQFAAKASGRTSAHPQPVPIWNFDPRLIGQAMRTLTEGGDLEHIIHLHGYCGCGGSIGAAAPASIVLASKDYDEAYGLSGPGDPRRLPMVLSSLLLTRPIVFIGFSFNDPFISRILLRCTHLFWQWDRPVHFAIMPTSPDKSEEHKLFAQRLRTDLSTECIFYQAIGRNHAARDTLISQLLQLVESRARRSSSTPTSPATRATTMPQPAWVDSANRASQRKNNRGNT